MSQPSINHATFVIERTLSATPERVFAAFADPARKRRWFADGKKSETLEFTMDFRVGGREIARFRSATHPDMIFTNETTYQDIVPARRIVLAYTMSLGEMRFSASLVTVELLPTSNGTDLIFTDQGAFFEGADGPQIREQGWKDLLDKLATEVAGGPEPARVET